MPLTEYVCASCDNVFYSALDSQSCLCAECWFLDVLGPTVHLLPPHVRVRFRHPEYSTWDAAKQWQEDKRLGLLDWDGK